MVFNNVYEMTTAPHVLKKSWFVEYFYGNDVKAYWTKNSVSGSPTFTMQDILSEGFEIDGISGSSRGSITFNNLRQFDPDASVFLCTCKLVAVGNFFCGLGSATDLSGGDDLCVATCRTAETFFTLTTSDNGVGSTTQANTSINIDTSFHRFKSTLDGTTATLSMDGILETTATSQYPATKMQPFFMAQGDEARIRYYEAYTT